MLDKKLSGIAIVFCVILSQVTMAQTWSSDGPLPREFHSAVLDPATNRMTIFGGYAVVANTNSTQNFNDVWRLSGARWAKVAPIGTAPAGRVGQSSVYDPVSNRMILFGGGLGRSSPCANDLWVLTNANGIGGTPAWIQLSQSGGPPGARMQHGAAYDPNTNTMIIFAGQNCFVTAFDDVWVLSNANGVSGTPTWTQLSPSGTGPGICEAWHSVAYDPASNTLMVFACSVNGPSNSFWTLSNANGQGGTPLWTQLSPSGTLPPARIFNTMTYNPSTNVATIFGGEDSNDNLLNDVWALSDANGTGATPAWTQLATGSTYFPEARSAHTAVYNSSTNKMVVFGGRLTPSDSLDTNDLFVLGRANGH